nr:MAG TPA: hypothetical protein [Caudoviricetes sp.]
MIVRGGEGSSTKMIRKSKESSSPKFFLDNRISSLI